MDKNEAGQIHDFLREVLVEALKAKNFKLDRTSLRFSTDGAFSVKIEASRLGAPSLREKRDQAGYGEDANGVELKIDDKVIGTDGKLYTVAGFKRVKVIIRDLYEHKFLAHYAFLTKVDNSTAKAGNSDGKIAKRQESEIIKDLQGVEGELSPENLSCDGELSGPLLRQKADRLYGRKKALIVELGREPTHDELWG